MLGLRKTYKPSLVARFLLIGGWRLVFNPSRPDRIALFTETEGELLCSDVTSIETSKGLLWHSVTVRSRTRTDILSGLSANKSELLKDHILSFVNEYLISVIEADKGRLAEIDMAIRDLTRDGHQYLAHADVGAAVARVSGDAANAISHPLFNAANVPKALTSLFPATLAMLTNPDTRARYNEFFVAKEKVRYDQFFSEVGGISLSDEQREACIRLEDSNLLVASAGAGKTATMIGKVAYVLDKGLYPANEILVLAFNSSAAADLRRRLSRHLKIDESGLECRVTTFHALGRAIIRDVQGRPPQLANWVENASAEAKFIQALIGDEFTENDEFRRLWLELLVLFPEAEGPSEIIDADEDRRQYRADRLRGGGGTLSTYSGTVVRSLEEQKIANWLWMNSVTFEYENQFEYKDEEGANHYMQPDFYYPETETFHEHFAINSNGMSPFEGYVEQAEAKRKAYQSKDVDFFETSSGLTEVDGLISELQSQLEKRGIALCHRSLEEVTKALDPAVVKRYHNVISVCIKHIRSSNLTLEMLLKRSETLRDPRRGRRFANAIWLLAQSYSRKLANSRRIDFDSMIGDAVQLIETARYQSPYSLILVDEFQDISESRANLIKALRHQKPFAKVFAVGDDWQSIYRFSGSDITIFTHFDTHFGVNWRGRLEQTYRSNQLIADTAAQFVQRNPEQLKKSVRSSRAAIPRSIRIIPVHVQRGEPSMREECDKVLERLNAFAASKAGDWQAVQQKLKVLILSRYNMTNPYMAEPPKFSHIDVVALTFHRSKGLEADYTILLDVSEGNYGVPSAIQDDELLHLVIPVPEAFPFAEERRLFYVALTRASRGVFILCDEAKPSRYIAELKEIGGDDILEQSRQMVSSESCPRCLVGKLVRRDGRKGSTFWGCDTYPNCKHTSRSVASIQT